jgi:archaellum component FlaG (FlaF/FlaG flagellin family)
MEALVQGWTGGNMPTSTQEAAAAAAAAATEAHESVHAATHAAATAAAKAAHDATIAAATAANVAVSSPGASFGGADYLKNVGNFVAAALDPFGIDVLVEIENAKGERQTVGSVSGSSSTAASEQEKV